MEYTNFLSDLKKYYSAFNYNEEKHNLMLEGHLEKLEIKNAGYKSWIEKLLNYLCNEYITKAHKLKILDIGCGTGELVVQMNLSGHVAYGIDLHSEHLKMAKVLASENNIPESYFIYNDKKSLPFKDNEFDLITSFSVFEHLDDSTLDWILPEINRVCKGVVFTLVPNPMKPIDDHTGLAFLGHFPRFIVMPYINLRGKKYQYLISRSNSWDVHYRYLHQIKKKFNFFNYDFKYIPDDILYPSLVKCPPIEKIGKKISVFGIVFFLGISLFSNFFIKRGVPKQFFYPYLNLISIPRKNKDFITNNSN
tara:strand:- start:17871 stop:18791 length:921 start_codon:yes stop_codon:yes gene_type:complete